MFLNGLLCSISDSMLVRESSCWSKLVCFWYDFWFPVLLGRGGGGGGGGGGGEGKVSSAEGGAGKGSSKGGGGGGGAGKLVWAVSNEGGVLSRQGGGLGRSQSTNEGGGGGKSSATGGGGAGSGMSPTRPIIALELPGMVELDEVTTFEGGGVTVLAGGWLAWDWSMGGRGEWLGAGIPNLGLGGATGANFLVGL